MELVRRETMSHVRKGIHVAVSMGQVPELGGQGEVRSDQHHCLIGMKFLFPSMDSSSITRIQWYRYRVVCGWCCFSKA